MRNYETKKCGDPFFFFFFLRGPGETERSGKMLCMSKEYDIHRKIKIKKQNKYTVTQKYVVYTHIICTRICIYIHLHIFVYTQMYNT